VDQRFVAFGLWCTSVATGNDGNRYLQPRHSQTRVSLVCHRQNGFRNFAIIKIMLARYNAFTSETASGFFVVLRLRVMRHPVLHHQ
jgi:hypothetical protein